MLLLRRPCSESDSRNVMSIQQRVLYPLGFLHQTTTSTRRDRNHIPLYHIWILHQTTTHNLFKLLRTLLYHIWILHQTTTFLLLYFCLFMLYHIWILHQTTTTVLRYPNYICCIIFGFYIKPQLVDVDIRTSLCCIIFGFYIKPQRRAGIGLTNRSLSGLHVMKNAI